MLGAVMLPLTANAFIAKFIHFGGEYNEVAGYVYTKEPSKVRVKISQPSVPDVVYTSQDAYYGLRVMGYTDNNTAVWGVSLRDIDTIAAPTAIQISEDEGSTWTSLDINDSEVVDRIYYEKEVGPEIEWGPYRINAEQSYSSVSVASSVYVGANSELFRFTPSNDIVNSVNYTTGMKGIGFNFGKDNVLNLDHITKEDFIVTDLTTNSNVPLAAIRTVKAYQYNYDAETQQYVTSVTITASSSELRLETTADLIAGHMYQVSTSSAADGTEIERLPAGTYHFNLNLGSFVDHYDSNLDVTYEYFDYRNGHFFNNVTVSSPTTQQPVFTYFPPATSQPEVKPGDGGVDFKPSADSIKSEKTADGKTNVTVTLKSEDLNKAFEVLGSNNTATKTINVTVDQKGDSTKVSLPTGLLTEKSKTNKDIVIAITSDNASFNLPLQAVNYDSVASQLGVNVADVTLSVSMSAPTASEDEAIRKQAKAQNVNIVNVVNFTVTAEGNGKSQEITNFGSTYIPRTIVVTDQAAGKPYMAVIVDSATGELQFIPASVDAKGNIVIMAPHASTYAIVEKLNVTFADIQSHWAKSDIESLASKLLIRGTSTDKFNPEEKISRAEFTALIARALGLEVVKSDSKFTDVASNNWYAKAIHAAVQAGIIQGRTATSFAPNATITREEMSIMIARALAFAGSKVDVSAKQTSLLSAFADQAAISSSAQTAVAQAVETKIVRGDSKGNFSPKANATRAEAAVTIKRLLEYLKFI